MNDTPPPDGLRELLDSSFGDRSGRTARSRPPLRLGATTAASDGGAASGVGAAAVAAA